MNCTSSPGRIPASAMASSVARSDPAGSPATPARLLVRSHGSSSATGRERLGRTDVDEPGRRLAGRLVALDAHLVALGDAGEALGDARRRGSAGADPRAVDANRRLPQKPDGRFPPRSRPRLSCSLRGCRDPRRPGAARAGPGSPAVEAPSSSRLTAPSSTARTTAGSVRARWSSSTRRRTAPSGSVPVSTPTPAQNAAPPARTGAQPEQGEREQPERRVRRARPDRRPTTAAPVPPAPRPAP